MADLIASGSPLPAVPALHDGVTIAPAEALRRYSLRGRDPAALSALVGRPLPERIGQERDGVIQLGPDEYYAIVGQAEALLISQGQAASVTEVSSRAVGIVVDGPRAAETIMAGCPLDMQGFAVRRATRTVFETVEIILRRVGDERFHIEVWRSFAPWLWQALNEAAHG